MRFIKHYHTAPLCAQSMDYNFRIGSCSERGLVHAMIKIPRTSTFKILHDSELRWCVFATDVSVGRCSEIMVFSL